MPIIKANEQLPPRQPVIILYGEPGVCKTSIINTCEVPLNLDFDRGIDRSLFRKDVLQINEWNEVLTEEAAGTFKAYKTIGIDTAKAALDDFLMSYVISQDYTLKKNKLGMYGAIGDSFKLFVNNRRSENAAIVIVAHAKKDEDTKKIIPDVTGQSYQLLLRIADQVGYVSIQNGRRVIEFEPTESTVGKNVAGLPLVFVPDKTSAEFRTFGAELVRQVREAIAAMSEEQREALDKSAAYQAQIAECDWTELEGLLTVVNELPNYLKAALVKLIGDRYSKELKECKDVDLFNSLFKEINGLPDYLKSPLRITASEVAKAHEWTPNKETKLFEAPAKDNAADNSDKKRRKKKEDQEEKEGAENV